MTEEVKNDIYIQPSNATSFFRLHMEAMKHCGDCPQEKSFALNKEGLSLTVLQQIAESFSVGKKCFVVFEHDSAFEVHRAADGTPRNLLMRYAGGNVGADAGTSEPVQALTKLLGQYLELNMLDVLKYDNSVTAEQKKQGEISQMYIQRRLLSTAAFKRGGNANEKLKEAIAQLISSGVLSKVENEEGESQKVKFVINKERLNAS